eukprot:11216352-Lingulodinium_polyedra.AAC.1
MQSMITLRTARAMLPFARAPAGASQTPHHATRVLIPHSRSSQNPKQRLQQRYCCQGLSQRNNYNGTPN